MKRTRRPIDLALLMSETRSGLMRRAPPVLVSVARSVGLAVPSLRHDKDFLCADQADSTGPRLGQPLLKPSCKTSAELQRSNPAVVGELSAPDEVARQQCEEADPCDATLDFPPGMDTRSMSH